MPSGVTANYVSGLVTISGTPTASGLFNYTVTPTGGCTGTTATGSITVNAPPAITTSGTINMLCTSAGAQTGTMAYSATTGSPVSYSIDWDGTANGEGLLDQTTTAFSFAAGGGDLNNIDVTAGIPADTYHGVMTITTAGGCTSTQAVSLLVNAPPTTADAGLPQTICSNSTATLAGNTPVTGTGEWSVVSGPAGYQFSNTSDPNALFTPGGSGTYILQWTISNDPCTPSTSQVVISVNNAPTADAGPDQTVCSTSPDVTLSGSIGGSATSGTWTTSGTGTFTGGVSTTTDLNTIYTPSSGDITAGIVALTLITDDPGAPCSPAHSVIIITIEPPPTTADAGSAQNICSSSTATLAANTPTVGIGAWSVVSGPSTNSSQISSLSDPAAIFTPDGGAGIYTLRWTITNDDCTPSTSDVVITVDQAATVDAGIDQTVCSSSPAVTLAGSIGGAASSSMWSGGTGTFNPDNTTLNAIYTPSAAEIMAGAVILTLTTDDPAGVCGPMSDDMKVTINTAASADAGSNQSICAGDVVNISGTRGGTGITSSTWTTSGTGTFGNASNLSTTYTPSAADITAGSVTLTLTTNDPGSPCGAASSQVLITVNSIPAAPGAISGPASVCPNTAGLVYSVAAVPMATTYTWTVPSGWTIDIGQGTNTITVTSGNTAGNITVNASNTCGSSDDAHTININPTIGTNNTGFTTNTTKSDGNISVSSSASGTVRYGYLKFPLAGLPSNAVISSSILSITNNASGALSGVTNNVRALGNNDPVTASAGTLFGAIPGGTIYNASTWNNTGTISLTLNSTANTDIQARISSPAYIAMGLERGNGSSVYNFFGYGGGVNAPVLSVTYNMPPTSYAVTLNTPTITTSAAATSVCFSPVPSPIGDQFASLNYSATTNSPTTYSITWNAAALTAGFTNVTNAGLPASPIFITVPGNTAVGTYNGTLTVMNAGGCVSTGNAFTVTVNPYPVASFHYAKSAYCQALPSNPSPDANPSPIFDGSGIAGTFTGSAGLVFVEASFQHRPG